MRRITPLSLPFFCRGDGGAEEEEGDSTERWRGLGGCPESVLTVLSLGDGALGGEEGTSGRSRVRHRQWKVELLGGTGPVRAVRPFWLKSHTGISTCPLAQRQNAGVAT